MAEAGSTVLEAARGAGFYVATLCSHSAIYSHGTSRLCIGPGGRGCELKAAAVRMEKAHA